ncbi:MAG: YlbF family regulator [Eubacterium sp.]|jgi:cell fate (sporulation/competence/biofilm development) regulator YlbF (YheA/YmcA/DUF963 family)|nr:YlbF family regulator [Eubacterium sp.]
MSQVQEMTNALVEAIEESEEYKKYQEAKKKILQYPILKEKADEFRRRNYEFQNSSTDHFEEGDKLWQEFGSVTEHPVVWEYLTAENALCRILRQVSFHLLEKLDFELNFENKEVF